MPLWGTIMIILATGLGLAPDASADNPVSGINPYGSIVERNVFGLNPPLPPPLPGAEAPLEEPPCKITPNGIMTIFGQLQVLFKVTNLKAGQPARDACYTLSAGESQDGIKVVQIDEPGGVVTFDNHGMLQRIPLAALPVKRPTTEDSAPH
jgi:hypothetical protein